MNRQQTLKSIRERSWRWSRQAHRGDTNAGQAARDRAWLIGEVDRLARIVEEALPAWELVERVNDGWSIVSTAELSAEEIALARASNRLHVNPQGYGFALVRRP